MRRFSIVAFILTGCAGEQAPGPDPDPDPDPDPLVVDDQSPPISHSALVPWLAEAAYETWACEPEAHPARPPGAHGENRICSNDLLSQTTDGRYPVGAASVKELVRGGQVTGFAVMRKLADTGSAGDWFWYEAFGDSVIAEGRTPGICTGCHSGAPRDFIFTRVE